MPRSGLSIGELAARAGVNLETVRYYERIGLMPEPARTEGGHRSYGEGHRQRLTFIRRGRELGFGLDEIRLLLELASPHRRSCDEVRTLAERHLVAVRAKIADLTRLESVLSDTIRYCRPGSAAPACPVLDMLEAT